ncbi:MAG: 8-oxo-dGTP diphosphatase [Halopseudomonas sp.]|jgi:8-oxo-dGTP diphosphatase
MSCLAKNSSRTFTLAICPSINLMSPNRIHVMAAVIRRDGRTLIARRPETAHQGGLWEFPGGKLETGEERLDGLRRELLEELGISVTSARPLIDISHDYADKSVRLDVWLVDGFEGEAHGAEGQPIRWVTTAELSEYAFPAANKPIVTAASLPPYYLITPDGSDSEELIAGLELAEAVGIEMVQLRQTRLGSGEYEHLAAGLVERLGDVFIWICKGAVPPADGAGWHLTARQLRALYQAGWCKGERFAAGPPLLPGDEVWCGWLVASCHDEQELQMAAAIGVDFVTLSPVLPTQSHPGAPHLGWSRAAELIALVNVPVYLLGGLTKDDLDQAQRIGAQGIAGISGLWPDTTQ